MNLGERLRELVEVNFPGFKDRHVTYSAKEAELRVQFRNNLPGSERVGWLISETLKEMNNEGYDKLGKVYTSIEMGVKMTISISAKSRDAIIRYNTSK